LRGRAASEGTVINSEDLIVHMRRVQVAERDLHDLGVVWQMIESSAAISCPDEVAPILPTLAATRQRFDDLQRRLIEQMVAANCAQLGGELSAKAQCAIDILVRNLYERTADVGFLATDDEVRAFCAADAAQRPGLRPAMIRRLAEYQAKYTVYDDVLLLSPQGEPLARLDDARPVSRSSEPLVATALAAPGHVERFGTSDLAAGDAPALLYGHRITGTDGRVLGVLVLRFRFADEMQRIFGDIAEDRHELALVLLDREQRVIATNDTAHVPLGARLSHTPTGEVALMSFAGREYLAVCCASQGYQGYAGPPWRALAMVSLLTAFRQRSDAGADAVAVPLDNPELIAVHGDADAINRELRRVVWNGRLMAGEHSGDRNRLKAVLRQVNLAGVRTRTRVNLAIRDLSRTSLERSRHQARELARLAADIMDRNLYERANDCRWWALSPVLRGAMAQPGSANWNALNAVLNHINGLYTVYSRLVVFDTGGRIRAASGADAGDAAVGRVVPAAWLQAAQGLAGSQNYAVSSFEATDLHAHGATYVYLAAIRDVQDERRVTGGIAIVFNAQRELAAMLSDIIGGHAGCAAFVGADGRVLAATDPALAAAVAPALSSDSAVLESAGVHYACARVRARGYREFKKADHYDNQVHALVALRLGAAEHRRVDPSDLDLAAMPAGTRGAALEAALFQVGPAHYALPASAVIEAVSPQGLVLTPGNTGGAIGMLEVPTGQGETAVVRVLCARQLFHVDESVPRRGHGVVLVLRSPQQPQRPAIGLRVDDVLAVLEVSPRHLHHAPKGMANFAPWVVGLIDCEAAGAPGPSQGPGEHVLVQLLALEQLAVELAQAPPALGPATAGPAATLAATSAGTSRPLRVD
jgi:chemotaxis signal transduction protein